MAKKEEDFSEISYILGIVSVVMAFFTPLAGFVFGVIGYVQSKKQNPPMSKKAKKLSTIGMVIGIILFAITVFAAAYTATHNGLSSLV